MPVFYYYILLPRLNLHHKHNYPILVNDHDNDHDNVVVMKVAACSKLAWVIGLLLPTLKGCFEGLD